MFFLHLHSNDTNILHQNYFQNRKLAADISNLELLVNAAVDSMHDDTTLARFVAKVKSGELKK